MPFIVLPGRGDVDIIRQKMSREKLGIDLMAQLQESVLKANGKRFHAAMDFVAFSPTLVPCCGRQWLSPCSGRVTTCQVT